MTDENGDGDRWTVRGVPKGYREKAAEAARRRKVQVGEWLCEAIDRHLQAEREPLLLLPHKPQADNSADVADAVLDAGSRMELVERAVAVAVALAAAPSVPVGFRRRANRLLRDSLPQTPRRRLALASSGNTDPNL